MEKIRVLRYKWRMQSVAQLNDHYNYVMWALQFRCRHSVSRSELAMSHSKMLHPAVKFLSKSQKKHFFSLCCGWQSCEVMEELVVPGMFSALKLITCQISPTETFSELIMSKLVVKKIKPLKWLKIWLKREKSIQEKNIDNFTTNSASRRIWMRQTAVLFVLSVSVRRFNLDPKKHIYSSKEIAWKHQAYLHASVTR